MTNSTLLDIRAMLAREGVAYKEVEHAPTRTSEESARARGEDIRIGGKALLIKTDDVFRLFVLSAALKINSAVIKKQLQCKKLRFATPDELFSMATLFPGAVPPFGEPLLPFPLYADPSILANDRIAFNAGTLTNSIVITTEDYVRIAKPTVFHFALDGAE